MQNKELFKKLQKDRQLSADVLNRPSMVGFRSLLKDIYAEKAHFIYELLQNADDAKAKDAKFILKKDSLFFIHNGTEKFSITDVDNEAEDTKNKTLGHVNSICSIGNTTKTFNPNNPTTTFEQKIGKYGIGFKSVFEYTSSPVIQDDNFNFCIENLFVPIEYQRKFNIRRNGETLFYFEFNLKDKSPSDCFDEIVNKLDKIEPPIILLLKNICKINIELPDRTFKISKDTIPIKYINPNELAEKYNLDFNLYIVQQDKNIDRFLLISDKIKEQDTGIIHHIDIIYWLNKNNEFHTQSTFKAYCFFPTQEETKLKFIIHAPFILTNNRQNIKNDLLWNKKLINALSDLCAKSIFLLKDISFLNQSFFEIIPIKQTDFQADFYSKNLFFIFYEKIRDALRNNELIPVNNKMYCKPQNAFLGRGQELIKLLDHLGLQQLLNNPNSYFIFKNITETNNNDLWKYLINELDVNVLRPEDLVSKLNIPFFLKQSDTWLFAFYKYFLKVPNLFNDIKQKPIVKTNKNEFIAPFKGDVLQVFLSSNDPEYPVIKKIFLDNPKCLELFRKLDITHPSQKDLVYKKIISRYNIENHIDNNLMLKDFENIFIYFRECSQTDIETLRNKIKNVTFLAAEVLLSTDLVRKSPIEIYFQDKILAETFKDNPDIYFFSQKFYDEIIKKYGEDNIIKFLEQIGVQHSLRFYSFQPSVFDVLNRHSLKFSYTILEQAIDYQIDSLTFLLKNISLDRSVFIWNYLNENILQLGNKKVGTLEYMYYSTRYLHFNADWYYHLLKEKWIFDSEGNLFTPLEITSENLHSNYNPPSSLEVIKLLNIQQENSDDRYNRLHDDEREMLIIAKKLGLDNLSPEKFEKLKSFIEKLKTNEIININNIPISNVPLPQPTTSNVDLKKDSTTELSILIPNEKTQKPLSALIKEKEESSDISINDKNNVDHDDIIPKPVFTTEQIKNLQAELEEKILEKTKLEELKNIAANSREYSYKWFQALLEIENYNRLENERKINPIKLRFNKIEKDPHSDQIIVLSGVDFIPLAIEDNGEIAITLFYKKNSISLSSRSVLAEALSRQNKILRAKLKKLSVNDLDLENVDFSIIELKNANFIYENLKSAFELFSEEPYNIIEDYNFQNNLPSSLEFIFGPPGTGKTTYIAKNNIYDITKNQDIRILVLTPTNKAADVLTQKIMDVCINNKDHSFLEWLVRFGITNDSDIEGTVFIPNRELKPSHLSKLVFITTVARFSYDSFFINTKNESHHFEIKNYNWDYIIFDESSMINLPSIIFAIFYRYFKKIDTKFIIGGDPFQIAPIVLTNHKGWSDGNIYSMVGLNKQNSFVNPVTSPHAYKINNLPKQYRSIQPIGELFSQLTYNGKLLHDRSKSDSKAIQIMKLNLKPLTIINFRISEFHSIYKPLKLKNSPYHIYSALFIIEMMNFLFKNLFLSEIKDYSIGIICPYRAQQNLIDKLIGVVKIPKNISISVGTIHGFQGDECDMIISLYNPPQFISDSENCFLNKQHIINVSISRARDYLIMLFPTDPEKRFQTEKLVLLNKINSIINADSSLESNFIQYSADQIEKIIFGQNSYLENASFPTSHQDVNVYSKLDKKYEIRFSENAVDVQIKNQLD